MTLVPRLDVLPAAQRDLWNDLATIPRTYVLYGGTALALRFGHRISVDFDFFSSAPLDHRALEEISWIRSAITIQHGPSERSVLVDRSGTSVKVSFFGSLPFGRVGDPAATSDGALRIASVLDLAGTKIKVLLDRVEAKDYRDIAALLAHGVTMTQILGAGRALFGDAFNPLIAQKALAYFRGGDLDTLDAPTREHLLRAAVVDLDVPPLPLVATTLA